MSQGERECWTDEQLSNLSVVQLSAVIELIIKSLLQ